MPELSPLICVNTETCKRTMQSNAGSKIYSSNACIDNCNTHANFKDEPCSSNPPLLAKLPAERLKSYLHVSMDTTSHCIHGISVQLFMQPQVLGREFVSWSAYHTINKI